MKKVALGMAFYMLSGPIVLLLMMTLPLNLLPGAGMYYAGVLIPGLTAAGGFYLLMRGTEELGYGGNVDIAGNIRYFGSTEGDTLWRWALYDMDWAFTSHSNSFTTIMKGGEQHSMMLRALLKNEEFRAMYTARLDELLATTLSDENVLAHVEYLYDLVYPEMPREREKWQVSMEIFEYYVNYTRDFIQGRAAETRAGYTRLLNELGIWE